jgi:hypothetical protein
MSELRFDWHPVLQSPALEELSETLVHQVQTMFPRKSRRGASPERRNSAYKTISTQLISSLYISWCADDAVSFPVRPAAYKAGRLGAVQLSHDYTQEAYKALNELKWISTKFIKDYTRIKASGGLKSAFEDIGVRWMPQELQPRDELIVLRDIKRDKDGNPIRSGKRRKKKKYPCAVPETSEVDLWRDNLEYINSELAKHCVSLDLSNINLDALKKELATKRGDQETYRRLYLHRVQLTRIFSRGSLSKGGRFYRGWWQSIPEIHRPHIRIDGKKVIEIDYSGISLRIISAQCGVNLPAEVDPYDIGLPNWQGSTDERRKPLKKTINALINDEDGDYKLVGTKSSYGVTPRELRKLFQKTHPVVYKRLADGIGLESQFVDSQIAESVMLKMFRDGIVCLPIHDSFLVPSGYHQVLSSVMKDTFREITGAEISVDLDIVKTDQLYGLKKDEILEKQKSDPEVGILSGSETWGVLKNEQKKLTTKFIQSWRVWSGN